MWGKKKIEIKEEVGTKENRLDILFSDGRILRWSVPYDQHKIRPWRNFYKWFFGRDNSGVFVMRHKDGETTFRKQDIRRIEITIALKSERDKFDL